MRQVSPASLVQSHSKCLKVVQEKLRLFDGVVKLDDDVDFILELSQKNNFVRWGGAAPAVDPPSHPSDKQTERFSVVPDPGFEPVESLDRVADPKNKK